jgi:glycerol-3-phosphate acyltransferase PlsX
LSQLTIALDIMGGDHGPPAILAASVKAIQSNPQHRFILCGDEAFIRPKLDLLSAVQRSRVTIEHCEQVVEMGEKPPMLCATRKSPLCEEF